MARTTIDKWDPDFLETSPIFNSIRDVALPFTQYKQWPTLEQFAAEFSERSIKSFNDQNIQAVAQGYTPEKFDDLYESRIYLKGELQTRLENWHDFFNAMCWLQFPKTKSTLNKLHFDTSLQRKEGSNRSPLENAIALFDECGAIIVADDEKYLELIRSHQWKEIFYDKKESWGTKNSKPGIQCYVFGHAMHEKALTPYIGMTTHNILLVKEKDFFEKDYKEQLSELDNQIYDIWLNKKIKKTKDLQPVPLLGIPNWYSSQDENFYNNRDYFRPGRNK